MNVVFHIDQLDRWTMLLGNITNMLKEDKTINIVVVVNGPAIQGYLLPNVKEEIKEKKEVSFHACQNAMKSYHIKKEELLHSILVVPSGVVDLVSLQYKKGYAYIKP